MFFMARTARVKSSTGKYIIMLRGIDETLFKTKKVKDMFSAAAKERFGGTVLGIRFFPDRAVLLAVESEKGISADMKPILIAFARALNNERNTDGKVFADRFKSLPVEDEEFLSLCEDYINSKSQKDPFNTAKKTAVKVNVTQKKKPQKKVSEEPKTEPVSEVKPKRRNDMPTWLL